MLRDDGRGPDVQRLVSGTPQGGGTMGADWSAVIKASAEKEAEEQAGAQPTADVEQAADEGNGDGKSEEGRPYEQAQEDVLSVLFAATGPLDLEQVAADANADRAKPFLPKGIVETLLHGDLADKVTRTDEGDPTRAHYALTPTARADIEAPGVVREARAAVVAVLGGQVNYMPRTGPVFTETLTAADVSFAMRAAHTREHPVDRLCEFSPLLPDGHLASFFHGLDGDDPMAVIAACESHLSALAEAGLVHKAVQPALFDDPSVEPPTYQLTDECQALFLVDGATAVVAKMYPPKPVGPSPAEVDALVEAQVKARVEAATTEAEGNAALFKREWEKSVKALGEAVSAREAYERWFASKNLSAPKVIAEALAAAGRNEPRDVFDYEQERVLDTHELLRVIAEERALSHYAEEFAEAAALRKGDDANKLKALIAKAEGLREVMGRAATSGRHVVMKKAYRIVKNGRLLTLSADPFDMHEVLEEEELPRGTQLEIAGAKGGDPTWTPDASAAKPAPTAQPVEPAAAPAAAAEPAKPVALPAPCGEVELKVAAVLPVLKAMVAHPAHAAGFLGIGGIASAFCAWTGMTRTQAMAKVLGKVVAAMAKKGDLFQGEGGLDALYWGPGHTDPRQGTTPATTGDAPVKRGPGRPKKKVAPAPSSDPRPEAEKAKTPRGKGHGRA